MLKELLIQGIKEGTFENKLYKFKDFGEYTDKIIMDSEFYFSSPEKFNDPFDCNLSFKSIYTNEEITSKLKKISEITQKTTDELTQFYKSEEDCINRLSEITANMRSKSGILSLSKNNKNITMWSHYSNDHQGLVFGLDVNEDYDFFTGYGQVEYRSEYNLLSHTDTQNEDLATLYLTKYTDWKYEDEIRIIDYYKNGSRTFNKKALQTIYFGFKASEFNIKKTIQLCKMNGFEHVEFKKAKLIPGKFALDFDDINKTDYLS